MRPAPLPPCRAARGCGSRCLARPTDRPARVFAIVSWPDDGSSRGPRRGRRTKRTPLALRGTHQDVRGRAHGAAEQDRLTDIAKGVGDIGMARTVGTRRAFAMHEQPPLFTGDLVLLELAGVMRDVVDQAQIGMRKYFGEGAAREVREYLTVGERAVDGRAHGAEILLAGR